MIWCGHDHQVISLCDRCWFGRSNKSYGADHFDCVFFSRSRTNSGSSAASGDEEKKNGSIEAQAVADGHKKGKNGEEHLGSSNARATRNVFFFSNMSKFLLLKRESKTSLKFWRALHFLLFGIYFPVRKIP